MTTYTIKPGNIAAVVHVFVEGSENTYIFMDHDKDPVPTSGIAFKALPTSVQIKIVGHFFSVFMLPVKDRGAYLKTLEPVTVEV